MRASPLPVAEEAAHDRRPAARRQRIAPTRSLGIPEEQLPHLKKDERAGLAAFLAHLRSCYGEDLQHVVLFGSKARGDFDAESDLDVLVVLHERDHRKYWDEITDFTSRLLLDTGVNISALVCDLARYQWWVNHRAPIYNSILHDGVELWTNRSERS